MATLKVKWRPSTAEENAGSIYYQITHNRTVRQLRAGCKASAEEWEDVRATLTAPTVETGPKRNLQPLAERIDRDLKRLNAIIGKFDRHDCRYTADDIVAAFTGKSHEQSFFCFMQSVIANLKQLNRHRTAENYATALKSFAQFRGNVDLLPGEINTHLMMRYEAHLAARGVTKNSISFYMRILRAVYNRAVEQELTEQRTPFRYVYTGVDKTVKRAIPLAAIRRIKELDLSQHPALDFARDMFLFSFYTRGMSFVDMAYLRKSDLKSGIIVYRRRKTGQLLSIKRERCMQEIVEKYAAGNCVRPSTQNSPYLLPILREPFDRNAHQYKNALQQINKSLKTIARMSGVAAPLTMYVARHSWASAARSKNIPISVISEGMGHDSETTTQIYLASLDTSVIDRANNLILRGL